MAYPAQKLITVYGPVGQPMHVLGPKSTSGAYTQVYRHSTYMSPATPGVTIFRGPQVSMPKK